MKKVVSVLVFGAVIGMSGSTNAQSPDAAWQPPRTEYGVPDLQGYWNNSSRTPLQRPTSLGSKRSYSTEEARQLQQLAQQRDAEKARPLEPNRAPPEAGGTIMFQADENFANSRISLALIDGEYRTSYIIEPEDGRFPYVADFEHKDVFGQWLAAGRGPLDGPEVRSQMERCLHVGIQMPPMFDWAYNANFQIVQTRDYVLLLSEMIHDARIIRIGDEHPAPGYPKWFGDSVASWEGDVLVVHTRDFHPQQSNVFMKSSDQLQVTEWFIPVSDQQIKYRYRLEDPVMLSEPVLVEMMLNRKPEGEVIYEFACHEGNYSLPSILAGARRTEVDASIRP